MKVAISVDAVNTDARLSQRFGRAPAFMVVETDEDRRQVYSNPAQTASGGAGVQAAEFLVNKGVQAVISGRFGPKAFDVLDSANITMYQAQSSDPNELITKLLKGDLEIAKVA